MVPLLLALTMIEIPFPQQTDIRLEVHGARNYAGPYFFFAPHENEKVINAYLIEQLQHFESQFIILRQNGERHLTLTFAEGVLEVDPNRIFTKEGAAASLLKINQNLTSDSALYRKGLKRARQLAKFICNQMNQLRPGTVIITTHNNTDGYDEDNRGGKGTVSMKRYQTKLEGGAGFIKLLHHGKDDEDDLFWVTLQSDFEYLKKLNRNVLMQHPNVAHDPDQDDGSLSVFAEMKGVRYFNIEAQRDPDHLEVNKAMLHDVLKLFGLMAGPLKGR